MHQTGDPTLPHESIPFLFICKLNSPEANYKASTNTVEKTHIQTKQKRKATLIIIIIIIIPLKQIKARS
jgi:hypothetical protein